MSYSSTFMLAIYITLVETIHCHFAFNTPILTLQKVQEEVEKHLKTAEMLGLRGDTHGQRDQIISDLLKVHTRFQARITEYQVLLNMTAKFFKNLEQVRANYS